MFRYVLSFTLVVCALALAQTPFDRPLLRAIGKAEVVELIDQAEEHLFVVTPALDDDDLANAVYQAAQRGVTVYLVVSEEGASGRYIRSLQGAGVEAKKLEGVAEGIVLRDYRMMAYGDLVSGSGTPTQLIDIEPFGEGPTQSLAVLWQEATPL